jgi:hypothetical protein|nr:MAG TPA: hypothetical protein [Caudoviricetes sp.]
MKKAIYKKDIKAMVKKFGLDEFEAREVEIMAESINEEKGGICDAIQSPLLYGTSCKTEMSAVSALIVYFGKKVNEDNKLQETTWKLSKLLKCSSYNLQQWFKGFACNKNRFGQFVECSDTYGLNYLEIA